MGSALYLNDQGVGEYLDFLRGGHPALFGLLSDERCRDAERHIDLLNTHSWEFEDEQAGGRGAAYNEAQKADDNRRVGMTALLRCLTGEGDLPGPDFELLDVLGGDGTFARFCRSLGPRAPTVYTADISRFMIEACRSQALPCIRQSATRSLFRDRVLDGVLIAYGSHHLGAGERRAAVREAHRTLKPGGRLVLHDFEIGGGTARWFDEVVHPYSRTGHPHAHFSRAEMLDLFAGAGFGEVRIVEIDDRFSLHGGSAEEARRRAVHHLYDMYDLIKVPDGRLEPLVEATLGPIALREEQGGWVAEVPRSALVAVGTRTQG